jgi:putative oxidoreductase
MKRTLLSDIIAFLLILLFVYTAASKLMDFEKFKGQMHNQTLPHWLATTLIWTLPEIELIVAFLLIFSVSRLAGLYASLLLMAVFTGYIGLVLLHVFSRVPCSCGGVLKIMGWKVHFFFNLFFVAVIYTGIVFLNRERRVGGDK